jgi:hypothetical protein
MESLKDRLSRYRQIKLTVVGGKSGTAITNPVWFVAEGDTLYLLPVRGSDTQPAARTVREATEES